VCCLLVHTNVNVEAAHDKGGAVLGATKVEGVAVFQDGVRTWCRSCVRLQVAAGAQRDIAARIRALSHSRAVLHLPRSRVLWTSVPTVDLSCSSHLFGLKACMHACTADTDLRVAAMLSHMLHASAVLHSLACVHGVKHERAREKCVRVPKRRLDAYVALLAAAEREPASRIQNMERAAHVLNRPHRTWTWPGMVHAQRRRRRCWWWCS